MKTLLICRLLFFVFIASSCVEDGTFEADDRLPILQEVLPEQGTIGDTITVVGSQLAQVDSVFINGALSTLLSATSSSLKLIIPIHASSGPVSASNQFGLSLGPDFTIVADTSAVIIRIDSLSPNSGKPGDEVKIYGKGFFTLSSTYTLLFNGLAAASSNILSDVEMIGIVPENASSGTVSITNEGTEVVGPMYLIEDDPQLIVQSISPSSGQVPIEIIITGQNFGTVVNDIEVRVNGFLVTVTAVNNTTISVSLTQNTTTGAVTVKKVSTNQEATGPIFTVLPPDPVIIVSTLAGSTQNDNVGSPFQIVKDGTGGYYFSDPASHRIKRVSAAGVVSNYAGSGQQGFADGVAGQASFNAPSGLTIDANGILYVADLGNHSIRRIAVGGLVTTVAGSGQAGFTDGFAQQQAQFNQPIDVAIDGNSLFISDFGNHAIRLLNMQTGMVSTLTGNGTPGFVNGNLSSSRFRFPIGINLDANKNILVADAFNHSIRLINRQSNQVSTIAGTGSSGFTNGVNSSAQFNLPYDVATDATGAIYVADRINHSIRKIESGTTSTLAGTGAAGFMDGDAAQARFANPLGLVVVSTAELLVCDFSGGRIRKITIE